MPVYYNQALVAVIGITGRPDEVRKYAHLAERITTLLIREQELGELSRSQADQRRYLMDMLLRQDFTHMPYLNAQLQEKKIDPNTPKRLVLIRFNADSVHDNYSLLEWAIEHALNQQNITLYSFYYPNEFRAVIASTTEDPPLKALNTLARQYQGRIKIAVGREAPLYQLKDSYDSARLALQSITSSQSDHEHNYILFDDMTLELILSSLPHNAGTAFVSKVLAHLTPKEQELLQTYFDTGASLTKTSGQLNIHKNTLQYQLRQIQRNSGFDPRNFHDSVLLYLALLLTHRTT